MKEIIDIKAWLAARGIKYREAERLANQLKKHYPELAKAVKNHDDVRCELELVELVYHVQSGRFPPLDELDAGDAEKAQEPSVQAR